MRQNDREPAAPGREVAGDGEAPQTSRDARRIIYVATVSLVVEDFAETERAIPRLVREFDGYLADASSDRTRGAQRSGRWIARIPVARYEAFLAALESLGLPERRQQTAEDVTEEFVDLESRIANKRRLEERILNLLEEHAGAITDVIEVERELARVREDIERMQGRLRFLSNRTELTTVTIHAREERSYVPPQAPTFTGQVANVWSGSLSALRRFGELAALAGVAAVPWLAAATIVIAPTAWYARRRRKHRAARR